MPARAHLGAPGGPSPGVALPSPMVARVQGAYYLATGVWPLIDRRSFEAVTGPKTDWWLVRTVGALIAVAGIALLADAGRARPSSRAAVVIGTGSALALAAVDLRYAVPGRVRRVYLLDAILEAGLVAGWLTRLSGRRSNGG